MGDGVGFFFFEDILGGMGKGFCYLKVWDDMVDFRGGG